VQGKYKTTWRTVDLTSIALPFGGTSLGLNVVSLGDNSVAFPFDSLGLNAVSLSDNDVGFPFGRTGYRLGLDAVFVAFGRGS